MEASFAMRYALILVTVMMVAGPLGIAILNFPDHPILGIFAVQVFGTCILLAALMALFLLMADALGREEHY